jgi:hypothetical protein
MNKMQWTSFFVFVTGCGSDSQNACDEANNKLTLRGLPTTGGPCNDALSMCIATCVQKGIVRRHRGVRFANGRRRIRDLSARL